MKRTIGFILLIISICMIVKGSMMLLENKEYNVKFKNVEGLNDYKIINGAYIQKPEEPVRAGYQFIGWYYEGKEFDFNTPVTKDIELEARWKEVKKALDDSL